MEFPWLTGFEGTMFSAIMNAHMNNTPAAGTATLPPGSTGTGYDGDQRKDAANIRNGKKHAAKQSKMEKAIQDKIVNQVSVTASTEPSEQVLQTLCVVFRQYVPAEWMDCQALLLRSLQVCESIAQHHPQLLGNIDDEDETLVHAIDEFGKQAEFLASASTQTASVVTTGSRRTAAQRKAKGEQTLIEQAKRVREYALERSQDHFSSSDHIGVMDPHQNYRKALRPHCFRMVDVLQHHRFSSLQQRRSPNTQKIFKEISAYSASLPVEHGSSIFVRVQENRLDCLRAMIIGPEDTPYANGCFIFDILLGNYPQGPPSVHFLTTGGGKYRFNPNLYNCGKVCLSLLGTWAGPGWVSGTSTLLQVLISIQSLILVPDPYFNEPGHSASENTPYGQHQSKSYNAGIRRQTLECAILPFLSESTNPYPEFQDAISQHFHYKRNVITQQLTMWWRTDAALSVMYLRATELLASSTGNANKKRAAKPAPIVPETKVHDDGCIEILDDDNEAAPAAHQKKRSKRKRSAEAGQIKPDANSADDDVVDLT